MLESTLLALNKCFRLPDHPFNRQDSPFAYANWQFEQGLHTMGLFAPFCDARSILHEKRVVDIGCGAGGKSVFFAAQGAEAVYGVEVLADYAEQARAFASHKCVSNFEFVCADAVRLPFDTGSMDAVMIADALEHVPDPAGVLREAMRVLVPGGRVYISFMPYYHPYGAHLTDAIGIPWVQLLFREATLVRAYKRAVQGLPDGQSRVDFRTSGDSLAYINKITLRQFDKLLGSTELTPVHYRIKPLRAAAAPLLRVPVLREMFAGMVICVLEK